MRHKAQFAFAVPNPASHSPPFLLYPSTPFRFQVPCILVPLPHYPLFSHDLLSIFMTYIHTQHSYIYLSIKSKDLHIKEHEVLIFLSLGSLIQWNISGIHPFPLELSILLSLTTELTSIMCVYPVFNYLFICQWASRLVLVPCCCQ